MYKIAIFPVVLCGCETWSLTLKKELRLKVFENKIVRNTFVPKRGEVTGGWRKLSDEGRHDLYAPQNIIWVIQARRMRLAEACDTNRGEQKCLQGFGGET
jgi:hypothetical protein